MGAKVPSNKYLSATATCSNLATGFSQTFPVSASPTKIASTGTLAVIATVATGVDGAAALGIGGGIQAAPTDAGTAQVPSVAAPVNPVQQPTVAEVVVTMTVTKAGEAAATVAAQPTAAQQAGAAFAAAGGGVDAHPSNVASEIGPSKHLGGQWLYAGPDGQVHGKVSHIQMDSD